MEDGERMNQAKPSPIIKIDALGKESVNAKLDQPDYSSSGIKREYIKAKDQADGSDDEKEEHIRETSDILKNENAA